MVWKGARIIFSPHFNSIGMDLMDEHRILVRNNHIGIAAHFGVVVARANVVSAGAQQGYGDSAIFSPIGTPLAEVGLFREGLATADVADWLKHDRWRKRSMLRPEVVEEWYRAACESLAASREENA